MKNLFKKPSITGISQICGKEQTFYWKKGYKEGQINYFTPLTILLLALLSCGCSKDLENRSINVVSVRDNLQVIEQECRKWNVNGFIDLIFTYPYLENEKPETLLSADCIAREISDHYYEINLTSDNKIISYVGNLSMQPLFYDQRISNETVPIDSTEALSIFLADMEVSRLITDLEHQMVIKVILQNERALQGSPLVWHFFLSDLMYSRGIHRYLNMEGEMIIINR